MATTTMQGDEFIQDVPDDSCDNGDSESNHSSVIRFAISTVGKACGVSGDALPEDTSGGSSDDDRHVRIMTARPAEEGIIVTDACIEVRLQVGSQASRPSSSATAPQAGGNTSLRHRHRDQGRALAEPASYDGAALVDLIDNPEYIDTLEGRLPLAAAAKMIARDTVVAAIGSGIVTPESKRRECHSKLLAMTFAIMLSSSAFFACYNVQTADAAVAGGARSQRMLVTLVLWSAAWLGSLFASPLMHLFTPRWVVVGGIAPSLAYLVTSFYPFDGSALLPAAFLQGLGAGLLWSAGGIYAVGIASTYSSVFSQTLPEVYALFNGIACMVVLASRVLGGMVAVVALDRREVVAESSRSALLYSGRTVENTCGPHYDWLAADSNQTSAALGSFVGTLSRGPQTELRTILAVLTMFVVTAGHMAAVNLHRGDTAFLTSTGRSLGHSIRGLAGACLEVRMLLLLPSALVLGFGNTIMSSNFTEAFTGCSMGAKGVVYTLLLGAVGGMLGAWFCIVAMEKMGKTAVACFSCSLALASLLIVQFWTPLMSNLTPVMFITSTMWYVAEGMMMTLLNGALGSLFKERLPSMCTAFLLCYGLASALGTLTITQLWGTFTLKLYVAMGSVALAFASFVSLEALMRRGIV